MIKTLLKWLCSHLYEMRDVAVVFRYVYVEHNYGTPKFLMVLQIGYLDTTTGHVNWRLAEEHDVENNQQILAYHLEYLRSRVSITDTDLAGDLRNIRHRTESDVDDSVSYYYVLSGLLKGGVDEWRDVTCFDFVDPSEFSSFNNTVFE